ncbi:MAG: hypothetical protein JWQ44_2181 [Chthoniobacter sp.]|nr:hypothetical protein [Chthoniobacter sp.]
MKYGWHLLGVALAAIGIGLLFLQEPGFGDDLTYWSFAFDLHERGLIAWQKGSFHDLRWPVWGVCWVLQAIFGFGLISYYGEPLLYLAAGSIVAFAFAQKVSNSVRIGWAAALAFPFHPLLDTVCYRPMPDLSEGVLGGLVLLAWWALMHSETRARSIFFAAVTGLCLFVLEANRITGAFMVPVLFVATFVCFPRHFGRVLLAGVFAALFYAALAGFYQWRFGDWLHDIHANLGNKEAKGTDFPNPWLLPFRFFDTLWKGNRLAPIYCIFAAVGIWQAWRRFGLAGRVVVIWFGVLFLEYSCAPQSLWPYRPLIRDADRFLAGVAIPMSVLAAVGCLTPLFETKRFPWLRRLADGDRKHWGQAALMGVGMLFVLSSRAKFDLGFVPEMRRYMAGLADGTRVFSHKAMREIAFLVSAEDARRFRWSAANEILHRTDVLEARAAQSDQFWYARKLVWLTTRKKLEKKLLPTQPALGSYFDTPEAAWQLAALFAKADNPDLVFYRRRTADAPPPLVLAATAAEWGAIPPLPAAWVRGADDATIESSMAVPPALRGRLARFEITAGSAQVEALTVRLRFRRDEELVAEYLLKPYLHAQGGKDFFVLRMPAESDVTAQVQLKFSKDAQRVDFTGFRAVIEPQP